MDEPDAAPTPPDGTERAACYRHPDRPSGVICQRCDRPICPSCMTQASVGFHCPECAHQGAQRVVRGPVAFDPIVTKTLIAMNVVATLAAWVYGGRFGSISGRALEDLSLFGPFVDDGDYYRIVTSAFLHDGVVHLGFNMWALWVLGPAMERALAPPRYLMLYVVSLLGGGFGVLLLDPLAPTVGASGAVFGLFGAMAVLQRSSGVSIWSSGIGPILAINLLLTFAVPQISMGGHLGGLLAGALVGLIFVGAARNRRPDREALAVAAFVGLMLAGGSIWAAAQWLDPLF